jgi:hypothetical protein
MTNIKLLFFLLFLNACNGVHAQTNPAIISWNISSNEIKQDTSNQNKSNIQNVYFSADSVFVETNSTIFKFPLQPIKDSNSFSNVTNNEIGLLLNGSLITTYKGSKLLSTLDSNIIKKNKQHSPIIGYAFDGFPIYGPFGFGNGQLGDEITQLKSSYSLRQIKKRSYIKDGHKIKYGPRVSKRNPLGSFANDYEFTQRTTNDYLDIHNGRFCKTPEYPEGNYCYFATMDSNSKPIYPFLTSPELYGKVQQNRTNQIPANTITYSPLTNEILRKHQQSNSVKIFFAEKSELIVVQSNGLINENLTIQLIDEQGKFIQETILYQGSTLAYFDTQALYNGDYTVKIIGSTGTSIENVTVKKK